MSTPLRVSNSLFKEAEFWAELGKTSSQSITNTELLALMQGIAKVRVDLPTAAGIDPQAVFDQVDTKRIMGNLGQNITLNQLYYEASQQNPGLLDEVIPNGSRRSGRFIDGEFIAE